MRDERLWFYVPDYPAVREHLERAYERFIVLEWSAEPGRVGGCPDDADVIVIGDVDKILAFRRWLDADGLLVAGVMVEGKGIT